jgi:hypothetical protein
MMRFQRLIHHLTLLTRTLSTLVVDGLRYFLLCKPTDTGFQHICVWEAGSSSADWTMTIDLKRRWRDECTRYLRSTGVVDEISVLEE